MGIPADQASLMAMYIRNFEVNLAREGKTELPIQDVFNIMNRSTQTLIEPIFHEINYLCDRQTNFNLTLKQLSEEREQIIKASERYSMVYVYLILALTCSQFIMFYYTIFHIDWLGRRLSPRLGHYGASDVHGRAAVGTGRDAFLLQVQERARHRLDHQEQQHKVH